jgi:hypothetical protein
VSDLNELFKVLAEGKKHYEENDPTGKKLKQVKDHAKSDLSKLFEELSSLQKQVDKLEESKQEDMIVEDMLTEEIPYQSVIHTPEVRAKQVDSDVNKYLTDKSFQQPNPDIVNKDIEAIRKKMQFLEQAIGRIAATGPGGGEVNLRWLDDIDRASIYSGRYLRYNGTTKKFEFAEVNPHDIVYETTLVTTPAYTCTDQDYYIGVNYAGPVTITIPSVPSSGRGIVIKDESGNASTNPITVHGTVDNDAGGFIIQLDNGGIQLLFRDGWRII